MKKNPEQAAAEVVYKFCSQDQNRPLMARPYHDKEAQMVVATDSRYMIATRHGFNPNAAAPIGVFPNWQTILPKNTEEEFPHQIVLLNPGKLAKICTAAAKLAKAANTKAPVVWFKVAGHVAYFDAERLAVVLEAMEANDAHFARFNTADPANGPLYVETADTKIMVMPIRMDGTRPKAPIAIDGEAKDIAQPPEEEAQQLPVLKSEADGWRILPTPEEGEEEEEQQEPTEIIHLERWGDLYVATEMKDATTLARVCGWGMGGRNGALIEIPTTEDCPAKLIAAGYLVSITDAA